MHKINNLHKSCPQSLAEKTEMNQLKVENRMGPAGFEPATIWL